ncbi:DUF6155 family protein [Flavobacterium sp. UMI-01]|uniref:DUF6155 family protein n=1 Tax=Flavobacterium sp. UMI-01 TaxID=1441053 RepID=UPI001C7CA0EE|nr:DUF6155 family protein [Flavobacterium sp. UMI-01]GIZ10571.1 hypothetical protein FUMI01_32950 [Flavobacterium sp. UMI-01]
MSKRELKKYLIELNKEQLEEQIISLYDKFLPVKTYYDFVFNPKEEVLLRESKLKISNEFFPVKTTGKRSKPKMRRSVAQKHIKQFLLLGVDPFITADLMLYTIEIALAFSAENKNRLESFYKSIFNSYEQAVRFVIANGMVAAFEKRIIAIHNEILVQKWKNQAQFNAIIELFERENN